MNYGFGDAFREDFPSQLNVDVTERCNLACIHCAHQALKNSKNYSGNTLSTDLNAKLVDEVREYGQNITKYIRYSANGEPLLHPHIHEMLEYAVRNSGVTVTLTTNGTLLNEKQTEELLATGVGVVDISIDAFTPETYAKIRVNGKLEITRKNVLRLLRETKHPSISTKIVVSYIEQPENIHETEDFRTFWEDRGADYVVVRRLHSNSGALTGIADHMQKDISDRIRRPCVYPWERIVLNLRGFLCFCPVDWIHGSTIPNADYRLTTIKETWQSEFYRRLRKAHLSNQFENHKFCGNCLDWSVTRWPEEGRSYATMVDDFNNSK